MLLEQFVFSKPYFDPAGLIVALRDGRPVGFVHAGFGPNDEGTALSTEMGTTYLLMLEGGVNDAALADELLGALRSVSARARRDGDLRRRHPAAQRVLSRASTAAANCRACSTPIRCSATLAAATATARSTAS